MRRNSLCRANRGSVSRLGRNRKSNSAVSLDRYRRRLASLSPSSTEKAVVFMNRSIEHASIVIEELFRRSKDVVQILTGSLNEKVYAQDGVKKAAAAFLKDNPSAHIDILFEEHFDPKNHALLKYLTSQELGDRVAITYVPSNISAKYKWHFAVADRTKIRLERNRDEFEALVNLGESQLGGELSDLFESIKEKSNIAASIL